MSKLYLFDFDNTIYDAESRLEQLFPEFDALKQTSYTFSDKKYLEAFAEWSFYSEQLFNQEVVGFISDLINRGISVGFYSTSPNRLVEGVKIDILKNLYLSIKGDMEGFAFVSTSKTHNYLNPADFEFGKFNPIINSRGKDKVIFVDDAPHRFDLFKKMGCKYIAVEHPYNKSYYRKDLLTLLPNYYKGWEI